MILKRLVYIDALFVISIFRGWLKSRRAPPSPPTAFLAVQGSWLKTNRYVEGSEYGFGGKD